MSRTGPPRAVLDSDIVFSRVLHELMGRVAKRLGLLDLVWSEELLAEARRSLVEKKGLSEDAAARWVGYLPQNFPDGETDVTGAAASVDLSALTDDPDDHHVCRLTIASGAAYLFTHDRGYLRSALQGHGVEVAAPDSFLTAVFDEVSEGFLDLLERQAADWAGGSRTVEPGPAQLGMATSLVPAAVARQRPHAGQGFGTSPIPKASQPKASRSDQPRPRGLRVLSTVGPARRGA